MATFGRIRKCKPPFMATLNSSAYYQASRARNSNAFSVRTTKRVGLGFRTHFHQQWRRLNEATQRGTARGGLADSGLLQLALQLGVHAL